MIEVKSYVFWEFCRDLLEYGKQGYTLETSNKYFPQQFGGYLEVHLNEPVVCDSVQPVDEACVGNEPPDTDIIKDKQENIVVVDTNATSGDTVDSSSGDSASVTDTTDKGDTQESPAQDTTQNTAQESATQQIDTASKAEVTQQVRRGRPPKK